MSVTVCSVLTSVFLCSILILAALFTVSRKNLSDSLSMLALLTVLCIIRLVFIVELPFAHIIRSDGLLPRLIEIGRLRPFAALGFDVTLSHTVMAVWIAGSIILLLILTADLLRNRRRLRLLEPVRNPTAEEMMAEIVRETKPGQRYVLKVSGAVGVPGSYGFIVPVITIPDAVFSKEDYRHILGHEWTHYLRRHNWVKLGVYVIWALFWWNPLIYLLKNQISRMLEVDCDRKMTAGMSEEERLDYLESTLKIMKHVESQKLREPMTSFGFIGPRDKKDITERFHIVLAKRKPVRRWKRALVAAALILIFAASYGVVIQPYAAPPLENESEFVISGGDSFILVSPDGTYSLYLDGSFVIEIDEEMFSRTPEFAELPMIYE